eukprot:5925344-Pyramimonas_sp.AAC.1
MVTRACLTRASCSPLQGGGRGGGHAARVRALRGRQLAPPRAEPSRASGARSTSPTDVESNCRTSPL